MKQIIYILIASLFWNSTLFAQQYSSPFLKNYTPEEYQAHTQNWSILQDKEGLIYIGNNEGVITYDGYFWDLILTEGIVRSLAKDSLNEIFVGTQSNFGMLQYDSIFKKMKYYSLSDQLNPKDSIEFGDVWSIATTSKGVYFLSNEYLFLWNSNGLKYWKADKGYGKFHMMFAYQNRIFLKYIKGGMYELVQDSIVEIPNGSNFAELHIFAFLPFANNEVLLGTYKNGIQIYHLQTGIMRPLKTKADDFFLENGIYNGIQISPNEYSIGTLNGGVAIIDKQGNVKQYITEKQGLQSSKVKNQWLDNDGNIWLALNYGFSKVEYNNSWTNLGVVHGLDLKSYTSIIFENKLDVGTPSGVYVLEENGFFSKLDDLDGQNWAFLPFFNGKDSVLLIGNQHQLAELNKGKLTGVKICLQTYFIHQSKTNPYQVYIGMRDGLGVVEYKNGKWYDLGNHTEINTELRTCYETENGNIWLSSSYSGIFRIKLNEDKNILTSPVFHFDTTNGLSSMRETTINEIEGKILIGQSGGVFTFDEAKNSFLTNDFFNKIVRDTANQDNGFQKFIYDSKQNIWLSIANRRNEQRDFIILRKENENYKIDNRVFKRLPKTEVQEIYPTQNYVYIATSDGLFVYNQQKETSELKPPNTLVRKVILGKDSILFNGVKQFLETPILKHNQNALTFFYSSPSYIQEEKTLFSYRLEGFDPPNEWSEWTNETKKEYTNLSALKNYVFQVRCQNIYGDISKPDNYYFTILKPWYLEWYALFSYLFLAVLLVYFIIKFYTYRLKLQNIKLEEIIDERTSEIQLKNSELEQYNEEILAQRDQIEVQKQQVEEVNEELNQINEEILAQRDLIEQQKQVVELKNEHIMASIRYAKRIQEAILPSNDYVLANLPDSFVLYLPKDVVSGDFYWLEAIGNKVFWAAVDCTGHGVPGAFMSILGYNGLKKIVLERGVEKPSEILNQLTEHVINSVKTKDGYEVRDGMDIALCSWDIKTNILEYAGAYNPLYLIRNNELKIIKGAKRPIGNYKRKNIPDFENHSIQLQKGDMIYTFTDGFADQFGGDSLNKFSYQRFRDLLSEIYHLPVEQQKQLLNNTLLNWRGNEDQLDDVCIIGVRI